MGSLDRLVFLVLEPSFQVVCRDGNGRMGRFVLNAMLASGGYNWTVVPVERRKEYMKALEKASVEGDISEFTKVIASLVK